MHICIYIYIYIYISGRLWHGTDTLARKSLAKHGTGKPGPHVHGTAWHGKMQHGLNLARHALDLARTWHGMYLACLACGHISASVPPASMASWLLATSPK